MFSRAVVSRQPYIAYSHFLMESLESIKNVKNQSFTIIQSETVLVSCEKAMPIFTTGFPSVW